MGELPLVGFVRQLHGFVAPPRQGMRHGEAELHRARLTGSPRTSLIILNRFLGQLARRFAIAAHERHERAVPLDGIVDQ